MISYLRAWFHFAQNQSKKNDIVKIAAMTVAQIRPFFLNQSKFLSDSTSAVYIYVCIKQFVLK